MFPWQSYNPNAFVERPEILTEIQHWIDDPIGDRQVLSIIAPPGTGKTWMLHYLKDLWQGKRLVVWVDAKELINRAEQNIRGNMLIPANVNSWVANIFTEAKQYCNQIPAYLPPPRMTNGKNLELLVTTTCQRCKLRLRPVVLVDGYDDVEEVQAEVLSDQLLASFISDECWRMIVARREQRRLLVYKLRSNDDKEVSDRLKVLFSSSSNLSFAQKQFNSFLKTNYPELRIEDAALVEWFKTLKKYHWGHPSINAYLFDAALRDSAPTLRTLIKKDFEACFRAAVQRRAPAGQASQTTAPSPHDNLEILLKISSTLDETWTEHDLDEKLGIKFWDENERIFDTGIIVPVPGSYTRYKIADGLRELLREIDAQP